ncbi:MAG: folate-binding protein [Nevskia sp.]|nr:folate-binding protein [Nevskia sp.]
MQSAHPIDISTPQNPLPAWLPTATGGSVAQPRADGSFDFGDAVGEAQAALQHTAIFPLAQLGSLQAQGADVDAFLQGQLSNDIAALTAERAQLSSYNSPKGRVLAVLTLTRTGEGVRLETGAELTAALLKRLRMYVLRAKVQWTDLSASHPQLGISGPQAAALLARAGLPVPAAAWAVASRGEIAVLRRPGTVPRYSVQAPAQQLSALWTALAQQARAAGPAAWQLLDILAGLPTIVAATQEHFVAQMLNLDTLGGISFTKGCYPGQEVVARLHYLGTLKRRMYRGYSKAETLPGTSVYAADGDGQAVGEVVAAAPHPQRGAALLLVLQTQSAGSAQLRLGTADGAALEVEPQSGPDQPA